MPNTSFTRTRKRVHGLTNLKDVRIMVLSSGLILLLWEGGGGGGGGGDVKRELVVSWTKTSEAMACIDYNWKIANWHALSSDARWLIYFKALVLPVSDRTSMDPYVKTISWNFFGSNSSFLKIWALSEAASFCKRLCFKSLVFSNNTRKLSSFYSKWANPVILSRW